MTFFVEKKHHVYHEILFGLASSDQVQTALRVLRLFDGYPIDIPKAEPQEMFGGFKHLLSRCLDV